jgi:UDP-2-acetamido-3-amino-2,3-dideoxy-glucuronate N-acetyltransferase
MILSLAGEEPEKVLATGGNYLHQNIADVTTTHLAFPSGLKAHVFVSWLHPFKEQKLVVVGDRKMAVFNDTNPWADKLVLYPHEIKWEGGIPVAAKAEPEHEVFPQTEPLRSECQHFLDSIVTGQQPQTNGHEGVRVLKVLNESQRSLDEYTRSTGGKNTVSPVSPAPEPTNHSFSVHPTAVIDEDVTIGTGTKIWHFSHILSGSRIGEQCNIGQNVVIGPEVSVGSGCKIQNNVSIYKGVTLEEEVFCGPSMVFTNVFNPRAAIRRMSEVRPTLVKKGATIGANATIVCDVVIGSHAFVGAGSVVTKNVKDFALVVGNPAQQIGWMCQCGVKLDDKLVCEACAKQYVSKEDEPDEIGPLL